MRLAAPSGTSDVATAFVPVAPLWWVTNLGGMIVNGAVALRSSRKLPKIVFALAAATHVAEATYAFVAARRRGLPTVPWTLQTLAVGFPSLRALCATGDRRG
jgi:hypothetical protein